VQKECRRLRRLYRHSPFLVLSGLAEGADRLIATVAMDELGAKLIAVLPFPAAEFCGDFASEVSRQEFSSLIGQSAAIFDVHLPPDDQWKQAGPMRDIQYARVGALIAEQSQILLALWDGRPARGVGGTGDVVDWFEAGRAPSDYSIYAGDLSLFDLPQPGMSIRIDPITGEREIHSGPPRTIRYRPRLASNIQDILRRTNTFNRDVRRQTAASVNKNPLVPPGALSRIPVGEASKAFEEADALAIFYSRRVRLANSVLYLLAMGAVFAFSSIDAKPLASWAFLAVMGVMAIVAGHLWAGRLTQNPWNIEAWPRPCASCSSGACWASIDRYGSAIYPSTAPWCDGLGTPFAPWNSRRTGASPSTPSAFPMKSATRSSWSDGSTLRSVISSAPACSICAITGGGCESGNSRSS
jgi:hypothetical protein